MANLPQLITTKQQEAYTERFDMLPAVLDRQMEEQFIGELIESTAHSVLDAVKKDIRGHIQASCDCGRELCDKRGWNLALTELLSRLERFSSNDT